MTTPDQAHGGSWRTWELSQVEIHNLRQLVGVVLMNCQLADRHTLTYEEAACRNLKAIHEQAARQYQTFQKLFASV